MPISAKTLFKLKPSTKKNYSLDLQRHGILELSNIIISMIRATFRQRRNRGSKVGEDQIWRAREREPILGGLKKLQVLHDSHMEHREYNTNTGVLARTNEFLNQFRFAYSSINLFWAQIYILNAEILTFSYLHAQLHKPTFSSLPLFST